MHDDRLRAEDRVERVLRERLRPARYAATAPLDVAAWTVPGEPVPVAAALAATFEPMPLGSPWGAPWSTTWLRVTGAVPPDWVGRRVELVVDLGFSAATPGFQAEALAYDLSGVAAEWSVRTHCAADGDSETGPSSSADHGTRHSELDGTTNVASDAAGHHF